MVYHDWYTDHEASLDDMLQSGPASGLMLWVLNPALYAAFVASESSVDLDASSCQNRTKGTQTELRLRSSAGRVSTACADYDFEAVSGTSVFFFVMRRRSPGCDDFSFSPSNSSSPGPSLSPSPDDPEMSETTVRGSALDALPSAQPLLVEVSIEKA